MLVVVEERKKMRKRSNVQAELHCHCFDISPFLLLTVTDHTPQPLFLFVSCLDQLLDIIFPTKKIRFFILIGLIIDEKQKERIGLCMIKIAIFTVEIYFN